MEHGHSVTLLTRGKKAIAYQIPDDTDESFAHYKSSIKHIASDRKDKAQLEERLAGKKFDGGSCPPCHQGISLYSSWHQTRTQSSTFLRSRQKQQLTLCCVTSVLYDLNGREADEADLILGALGGNVGQYIFCSSAGVYKKSYLLPHHESDAGDPKSRHKVCP